MELEQQDLLVQLAEYIDSHRFGKYRGTVAEVGTGDRLGLIRAYVPEVFGESVSPWARPAVPFAGRGHGFVAIPEQEDGVWIEFEAGSTSNPIWTGCWWAANEMPTVAGPETRAWITTAGHQLVLDDDANEIRLVHADGPSITIKGNEILIKVGNKQISVGSTVSVNNGSLEVS